MDVVASPCFFFNGAMNFFAFFFCRDLLTALEVVGEDPVETLAGLLFVDEVVVLSLSKFLFLEASEILVIVSSTMIKELAVILLA